MPTPASSDQTPQKGDTVSPTLSDAQQPHPTHGPSGAAGGVILSVGQRPLPEYELVRLLGRGGFGEVWQARGPGGFDVALKFVRLGERVGEAELRALDVMKGVRHAHLLPMFGAWQRDGLLIVAMELADGTLLDRLRRTREQGLAGVPREELLEYMREAAKGLDFLNEGGPTGGEGAGIQHKDVKPQNLLLVGGTVKVADFGLARVLEHTVTAASGGLTPAYAPPEFFSGQVTRWSDQYSLAMSYCQLRGGRLPFAGSAAQVMAGHLHQVPELDMLPEAERAAVARALAKKPEERWPSCRAFVTGLQAGGHRGPAPRAARRRAAWVLSSLVVLGLLALAVVSAVEVADSVRLAVLLEVLAAVIGLVWLAVRPSARRDRPAPGAEKPAEGAREGPRAFEAPPAPEGGKDGPEPKAGPQEGPVPPPPEGGKPKEAPGPRGGEPFTNSVGMKFVWIKPGTFHMGSPPSEAQRGDDEILHRVTLARGFHLGAHLVTQHQWEQVMGKGANESKFRGKDEEEKKRLPVDSVSWQDCQEFCRKLGTREGLRYRLPTEAEWEYACRAGTTTAFWWGDSITPEQANYDGTSTYGEDGQKGEGRGKTTPVGLFPPNPWGLHDMHGNLWQWCEDAYAPYGGKVKGGPEKPGKEKRARVLRGGSWVYVPWGCRAASRRKLAPDRRNDTVGCRVVLCLD